MPFRLRVTSLLVASLAAIGLSGCGEKTVKSDQAETIISDQFKQQGIPITEVTCPDDIKAAVGTPVACTALNPSKTTLKLEGKITKVDGDKARFEVKAVGGTAEGPQIAKEARALIEQQVGEKAEDFTCPDKVEIPTKPNVTCAITVPGGEVYDAAVTVDAQSKIGVEVAQQPRAGG